MAVRYNGNNMNRRIFNINCLQINLMRSKKATNKLNEFLTKEKIDVLLIQEPYCVSNNVAGFSKKYRIYQKGLGRKRAAIIILNSTLDVILLSEPSNKDMVIIEINSSQGNNTILMSIYLDINRDIKLDLYNLKLKLDKINNSNYLFCADTNSRAVSWYDRVNNGRGKILESFLAENSMIILNEDDGLPTFHSSNGDSNIDLSISSLQMSPFISNWKNLLLEEESLSDHAYIQFMISCQKENIGRGLDCRRYKIGKADWLKFELVLKEEFINRCMARGINDSTSLENVDDLLKYQAMNSLNLPRLTLSFNKAIEKACNKSIPIRNENRKYTREKVCWWNSELTEKRKQVMSNRRKYQKFRRKRVVQDDTVKREYFKSKKEYGELILKAKLDSWKNYCNSISGLNPWNLIYKISAGKIHKSLTISTIKKDDGSYTSDFGQTIETVMDKFFPRDDEAVEDDYHAHLRQEVKEISTNNDIEFSTDEVRRAISRFETNKTPGIDGIVKEIMNKVFELFPKFTTQVYNECLKRGYFPEEWKHSLVIMLVKPGRENSEEVGKYRPISLLPFGGKVLERLLIDRIMHYLRVNNYLSDRQMGFTPQTSTTDAAMKISSLIENNLKKRKKVALISMDVEGAFDAAWWPAVLSHLKAANCPKNLFQLSGSYFSFRKATLKVNNYQTTRIVEKGCPQGSCCGPGYWNIMYDSVLKLPFPKQTEIIGFADDLILLVSSPSILELESLCNESLFLINDWANKNKIVFNPRKSNVLLFNRRGAPSELNVYLNGKKLELVSELKYLGIIFDNRFNFNQHIDSVCQKSLQIINVLSRSAKVYWGLAGEALRTIYISAIEPLLTYAAPVWGKALHKNYNKAKFKRVQRLMALRIIKGFKTISYEAAVIIANIEPILLKIQEKICFYKVNKFGKDEQDDYDKEVGTALWIHPGVDLAIDIKNDDEFKYCIYTDGSKCSAGVGCAFVVYEGSNLLDSQKYKLGFNCSNNQAEQLAILMASLWLEDKYTTERGNKVIIKTDSKITIDTLKNRDIHWPIVEQIRNVIIKSQWTIRIEWIKAHIGTVGNELADQLAKQAANDQIAEISYCRAPKTHFKKKFRESSERKWDEDWNFSIKGRTTKEFISNIESRKKLCHLKMNYRLTQVLSGHGRTKYYLHRFHIVDDARCICDNESDQTWDHLIFSCPLLEGPRRILLQHFTTTGHSWPPSKPLLISKEYLPSFTKFLSSIDMDVF